MIQRFAALSKFIGLLLMVATLVVVLNISETESKIVAEVIGGCISGFVMTLRFAFIYNNDETINKANENIRKVGDLYENHPIRKSLIDVDRKLTGNPVWLPKSNMKATANVISILLRPKTIVASFFFAFLFIYGSVLQTDVQGTLHSIKMITFQAIGIFCISTGFLGMFLNLLSVANKQILK